MTPCPTRTPWTTRSWKQLWDVPRPTGTSGLGNLVARFSLMGASLLCSTCLVNAPAELEVKEKVPPRFSVESAVPVTTQFVTTEPLNPLNPNAKNPEFLVRYTSEDLGEDVIARLYLNWDPGGPQPPNSMGSNREGAHSLEDGPQEMRVELVERPEDPGCYSLTMIISHISNFDSAANTPVPIDASKADFITWWILHDDPDLDVPVASCFPADTP